MAYVPVSRTIAKRFGGEANLRMAVSKAVSGRCRPLSGDITTSVLILSFVLLFGQTITFLLIIKTCA